MKKAKTESVTPASFVVDHCTHELGYLSQRPKGEEIPVECMTCKKVVECMLSSLDDKAPTGRTEKNRVTSLKSDLPTSKGISETPQIKDDKKYSEDLAPQSANKTPEEIPRSEVKIENPPIERSENEFKVEKLDMLYASWSKTVRIDKESLPDSGRKVREIEVETADGKKVRCRVQLMENAEKGVIQIPDKVLLELKIGNGERVKVKPVAH